MALKNPFKTKNVVDTIINVGIGGAGNVLADKVIEMAGWQIDENYKNLGKALIGAVGSSMVSNKYVKALMDGFATVGASNYISKLVTDEATSGVPAGTIGHVRYVAPRRGAARGFAARKMSGVPSGTISSVIG